MNRTEGWGGSGCPFFIEWRVAGWLGRFLFVDGKMMNSSTRKGFTLIEMVVAIAIIAIIATIAIPNLLQGRLVANEAAAITMVKGYATAQVTFQVGKQGMDAVNTKAGPKGYCDNFRNLYYGNPKNDRTNNLALLSRPMADAFARDPAGNAAQTNKVPTSSTAEAVACQGYMFSEPNELRTAAEDAESPFESNFAILAVPYLGGQSGNNMFWVDQQGIVWMKAVSGKLGYGATITEVTPSTPGTSTWWIKN